MPSNPTQFIYSTTVLHPSKTAFLAVWYSWAASEKIFCFELPLVGATATLEFRHSMFAVFCLFLFLAIPYFTLYHYLPVLGITLTASARFPVFCLFLSLAASAAVFSVYFCLFKSLKHEHVFCLFLPLAAWACFLFISVTGTMRMFSVFSVPGSISSSDWRLLKESPSGLFYQQITPFTPNTRK